MYSFFVITWKIYLHGINNNLSHSSVILHFFLNQYFLRLIVTRKLYVIYVREENDSNM